MASYLKILLRNLLQGPSTDPFPAGPTFEPDTIRGKIKIDPELCMGCGMCVHNCVSNALHLERREDGHTLTCWDNLCCRCATCVMFCPTKAITLLPDWHTAHYQEDKYARIEQQSVDYEPCSVCGRKMRPVPVALLKKLYAGKTDVDAERLTRVCPDCRQIEDSKRNIGQLPA